jgi:glycosyltransferase involved in cell wall biosynthesis
MVLHVGSCVGRKNVSALLDAFAGMVSGSPTMRFAQVGGRFTPEQRRHISRLGLDGRVVQLAHVDDADLPAAYAAADVLVVPSLFEGFGLPVLEAFAVGVPVVATRNAALREFPEDLLQTAGTGSAEAIECGIRAVLGDLEGSSRRAARAREWASRNTWRHAATEVVNAYTALM